MYVTTLYSLWLSFLAPKKITKGQFIKTKRQVSAGVRRCWFQTSPLTSTQGLFTPARSAVPLNGGSRSNIAGQINGSSKPWNFPCQPSCWQNIPLTWAKKMPTKRNQPTSTFIREVLNLFNQNVLNVWATLPVNPNDDFCSSQAVCPFAIATSKVQPHSSDSYPSAWTHSFKQQVMRQIHDQRFEFPTTGEKFIVKNRSYLSLPHPRFPDNILPENSSVWTPCFR